LREEVGLRYCPKSCPPFWNFSRRRLLSPSQTFSFWLAVAIIRSNVIKSELRGKQVRYAKVSFICNKVVQAAYCVDCSTERLRKANHKAAIVLWMADLL